MTTKLKPEIVDGVPRCTEMCPLIEHHSSCEGGYYNEWDTCLMGARNPTAPGGLCEPAILAQIKKLNHEMGAILQELDHAKEALIAKLEAVARAARGVVKCDDPNSIPLFEEILLDALDALKEEA